MNFAKINAAEFFGYDQFKNHRFINQNLFEMDNQIKVLNELLALVNLTAEIPKGVASFKQLKANTGLGNEELDQALIDLEQAGYIIEYPMSDNDAVPFQLTAKGFRANS